MLILLKRMPNLFVDITFCRMGTFYIVEGYELAIDFLNNNLVREDK